MSGKGEDGEILEELVIGKDDVGYKGAEVEEEEETEEGKERLQTRTIRFKKKKTRTMRCFHMRTRV